MATVTRGAKVTEVANLGWLIRHSGEVKSVVVVGSPSDTRATLLLRATLHDGTVFETTFQSTYVCRQFLRRSRNLRGVPLLWFGIPTHCDSQPR